MLGCSAGSAVLRAEAAGAGSGVLPFCCLATPWQQSEQKVSFSLAGHHGTCALSIMAHVLSAQLQLPHCCPNQGRPLGEAELTLHGSGTAMLCNRQQASTGTHAAGKDEGSAAAAAAAPGVQIEAGEEGAALEGVSLKELTAQPNPARLPLLQLVHGSVAGEQALTPGETVACVHAVWLLTFHLCQWHIESQTDQHGNIKACFAAGERQALLCA